MGEQRARFPKARLLLVDVDLDSLRVSTAPLQQQGYEVRACTSYEEALACLETETYDFILVEQGSPSFEGRAVLARAVETDRQRPVLVVARCSDIGCYLDAMQMGAVDYLEKPIPAAFLSRFVETHLRTHKLEA